MRPVERDGTGVEMRKRCDLRTFAVDVELDGHIRCFDFAVDVAHQHFFNTFCGRPSLAATYLSDHLVSSSTAAEDNITGSFVRSNHHSRPLRSFIVVDTEWLVNST